MNPNSPCPCGSSEAYARCCGRFHAGELPESAEQLMRSRFSAFRMGQMDYIRETWHPATRPNDLDADASVVWSTLVVHAHTQQGDAATVEFEARFLQLGERQSWCVLTEASQFSREQGRWYYVEGKADWQDLQPGRNDVCPCGSGRKYKKCCAVDQSAAFVESARRAF